MNNNGVILKLSEMAERNWSEFAFKSLASNDNPINKKIIKAIIYDGTVV